MEDINLVLDRLSFQKNSSFIRYHSKEKKVRFADHINTTKYDVYNCNDKFLKDVCCKSKKYQKLKSSVPIVKCSSQMIRHRNDTKNRITDYSTRLSSNKIHNVGKSTKNQSYLCRKCGTGTHCIIDASKIIPNKDDLTNYHYNEKYINHDTYRDNKSESNVKSYYNRNEKLKSPSKHNYYECTNDKKKNNCNDCALGGINFYFELEKNDTANKLYNNFKANFDKKNFSKTVYEKFNKLEIEHSIRNPQYLINPVYKKRETPKYNLYEVKEGNPSNKDLILLLKQRLEKKKFCNSLSSVS